MGVFGLFGKKQAAKKEEVKTNTASATAPENDAEKWYVASYAMWSTYTDGDWHFVADSKVKNQSEGASMRTMLRRDWLVSNKEALLDMADYLVKSYEQEDCAPDELRQAAWDLCRANQILGMGYVGDYINRAEMDEASARVSRIMQKYFHSWNELYDSYLIGYRKWRSDAGEGAEQDIEARENLCRKLLEMPDGPSSLDWNTQF